MCQWEGWRERTKDVSSIYNLRVEIWQLVCLGREIDLQDTERESSSQGNLQAFSHTASHIYIQLPPHRLHSNLLLRSIQNLHSSHTSKDTHAHSDHPEASTFSRPGDPNYRLSSSHVVTGHRKHVLPWEEVSNQTASFSTLGGDSASVRGALCRRLKRALWKRG